MHSSEESEQEKTRSEDAADRENNHSSEKNDAEEEILTVSEEQELRDVFQFLANDDEQTQQIFESLIDSNSFSSSPSQLSETERSNSFSPSALLLPS